MVNFDNKCGTLKNVMSCNFNSVVISFTFYFVGFPDKKYCSKSHAISAVHIPPWATTDVYMYVSHRDAAGRIKRTRRYECIYCWRISWLFFILIRWLFFIVCVHTKKPLHTEEVDQHLAPLVSAVPNTVCRTSVPLWR